jgi:hypothetical protein
MNPDLTGESLKEKGKKGVLVTMNMDKVGGVRWLGLFSKEMDRVKRALLQLEAPTQARVGSKNPISSRFNKLLCLYEDQLLRIASDNLKICCLMFDGFLTSEVVQLDKLNELTSQYGVEWTIKPPSTKIKLPDGFQAVALDADYNQFRETFERGHVFINSPYGIHRLSDNKWELRPVNDVIGLCSNFPKFLNDEGKPTKFIQLWLEDPDRATYENMTFCPFSKNPPKISNNNFNTFIEFSQGGSIETDFVTTFLLPLTLELCECNEILQTYLLNWIAHLIQYPEELPEVMIVFKGREGNGKDTLGQIITKILGNKYTHYTDKQGEILGKFNSSAKEKLLITLNEGTDTDAMTYVEPMKHFFCARQISIKGECKEPYMANNYARGIMNSNNVRPIQVTDTNRRFFVVRTTDKYMGNKEWFGKLYNELEIEGVSQTIFNWFYERDISEFKVRDFPKGSLEQLLKDSTVKPITRFIQKAMTDPMNGWAYNPKNHNELWVNKAKIIVDLKLFCGKEGYSCSMTAQRFKLELSDLSTAFSTGQRTIDGRRGEAYIFNQKQVLEDVLKKNTSLVTEFDPDEYVDAEIIHTFGIE